MKMDLFKPKQDSIYKCINIYNQYKPIINNSNNINLIGIGGSYMATKAITDALKIDKINFISPYFKDINVTDNDFYIIVSKSGTTAEVLYYISSLEDKINEYNTIIITDPKSPLEEYAVNRDITFINTDKDIGGRFSAFDVSTLFPLLCINIDIEEYLNGYNNINEYTIRDLIKFKIYNNKKDLEIISTNSYYLESLTLWYQQLISESSCKNKNGIIPITILYPRDLHSLEQAIQDGKYSFSEISIVLHDNDFKNRLTNAALEAHENNGIIVNTIDIYNNINIYTLGSILHTLLQVSIGYCNGIGINPYGQPGVENYKSKLK